MVLDSSGGSPGATPAGCASWGVGDLRPQAPAGQVHLLSVSFRGPRSPKRASAAAGRPGPRAPSSTEGKVEPQGVGARLGGSDGGRAHQNPVTVKAERKLMLPGSPWCSTALSPEPRTRGEFSGEASATRRSRSGQAVSLLGKLRIFPFVQTP